MRPDHALHLGLPLRWSFTAGAAALVFLALFGGHGLASAQSPTGWAVCLFGAKQFDPATAEVFTEIVESEIAARSGIAAMKVAVPAANAQEAVALGAEAGASHVVFGSISPLGSRLIVRATALRVSDGSLWTEGRLTALSIEDLENVGIRLGSAIAQRRPVADTAELGTVVEKETEVPQRREGIHSFGLRVGSALPINHFQTLGPGVALDASYIYEGTHFALEPRVGVRFSADRSADARWIEVPIDLGAYYLSSTADVAFLGGGGFGMRYRCETVPQTQVFGELVQQQHRGPVDQDAFGVGGFARVGVLLFRTYSVRLSITADFDMAFFKMHEGELPMTAHLGVGIWL